MAMTVISVGRVKPATPSWAEQGRRYEDEQWLCQFTGEFDPVAAILSPPSGPSGVPAKGSVPNWDLGVIAESVRAELEPESLVTGTTARPGVYRYTVSYGAATIARLEGAVTPVQRSPVIRGGGGDLTEVRTTDASGAAMVNSAGDLYAGLPEQYVPSIVRTVTYNTTTNPLAMELAISNTTNQGIWYGRAAGTVWMKPVQQEKVVEAGVGADGGPPQTYWRVTITVVWNPDGWRWKPLDRGLYVRFYEIDATNDAVVFGKRRIVDRVFSQPVDEPQFLNGAGRQLASGATPVVFPADGYQRLKPVNLSAWPEIPDPFA